MASAGIAALLKKMDYKDVVIAIDGSLFRYHPHFKNVMKSRISQLMGIDFKFDLMLSEDRSGRGGVHGHRRSQKWSPHVLQEREDGGVKAFHH